MQTKTRRAMNRATRIDYAKAKLSWLKPMYERMKREWEWVEAELRGAEAELRGAEESIEPGDHVRIQIFCNRGCCMEEDYEGEVVKLDTVKSSNNYWIVRPDDSGQPVRSVMEQKMRRIK